MNVPFRRVSLPASQWRLTAAVITAFSFSALLFLASTSLRWLTPARGFLVPLGIVGGCLFGLFETQTVIQGLTKNTKTVAWQILPVGIVLFGLPLLLGKLVLADSEFLPFAAYLTLPAFPVFSAVSGWRFHRFERANQVQVFVLFTGYSYYTTPLIVDNNRLYYFIRHVATKDYYSLWQQAGYSKRLMATLEERQDIDSVTRKELLVVLKVMNKYRWIGLTALALFIVSVLGILAPIITDMTGLTKALNTNTLNIIGPASGAIVIGFGLTIFLLLRTFNKKILSMTAKIDPNTLLLYNDFAD